MDERKTNTKLKNSMNAFLKLDYLNFRYIKQVRVKKNNKIMYEILNKWMLGKQKQDEKLFQMHVYETSLLADDL